MDHMILISQKVFLNVIGVSASASSASIRLSKDSSVAVVKWSDQLIK